jgi:hypothetical protein
MGRLHRFEGLPMTNYPLAERKLVFRVLHAHLTEHPELMDTRFLDELQSDLQADATAEGVDVTDHQAWDTWLGNKAVGCDVRLENRRTIR